MLKTTHPGGPSGRRAFTLIELLAVIAVIAVLAGISLPVVSKVRESGNAAKCTSNLRQIGAALNLYAADNNNGFPKLTGYTNSAGATTDWDTTAIDQYLPERTKNGQQNPVFICPSAKYTGSANSALSRTYMAAEAMLGPDPTGTYTVWQYQRNRNSLVSTSGTLLLVDGAQSGAYRYCTLMEPWIYLTQTTDLQPTGTSTYIDYRHNRSFNGVYADGHVATVTRATASTVVTKQMWTGRAN